MSSLLHHNYLACICPWCLYLVSIRMHVSQLCKMDILFTVWFISLCDASISWHLWFSHLTSVSDAFTCSTLCGFCYLMFFSCLYTAFCFLRFTVHFFGMAGVHSKKWYDERVGPHGYTMAVYDSTWFISTSSSLEFSFLGTILWSTLRQFIDRFKLLRNAIF